MFTNTLSPLLEKTASEPGSDVRVITVSGLDIYAVCFLTQILSGFIIHPQHDKRCEI